LGDRLAALRAAAAAIADQPEIRLVGRSSVYETAPAGGPPQPDYLNAAVLVQAKLAPRALLERAHRVERRLGRHRPDAVRWGPRTIDVDLLWTPQGQVQEPGLAIPHPRLAERPFALVPLLELVADAADPATGRRYAELPAASVPIRRVAWL